MDTTREDPYGGWGTTLSWRWGLWAPRILQIPFFRNPKGRTLLRVPVWLSEPGYVGAKISGTRSKGVFTGRSGSTTTCKHYQELTKGLLEVKVTVVFTASMPFMAFSSRLRAAPVVVGPLATVPPRDCFLSPARNR